MELTSKQLINFLTQLTPNASFVDRLKIKYRPLVCPFPLLLNQIEDNDVVADIGCGSGQFLLLAAQFKRPSKLIGFEIHQRLIDQAQQLFGTHSKGVPSHLAVFDGTSIPDVIGQADKVFLIDVLHHVPRADQDRFVATIYSSMKPGARLLIKDINAANPLVLMNKLHDWVFAGEIGAERKPRDIQILLKSLGAEQLNFVTTTTLFYPHYLIDVKKS